MDERDLNQLLNDHVFFELDKSSNIKFTWFKMNRCAEIFNDVIIWAGMRHLRLELTELIGYEKMDPIEFSDKIRLTAEMVANEIIDIFNNEALNYSTSVFGRKQTDYVVGLISVVLTPLVIRPDLTPTYKVVLKSGDTRFRSTMTIYKPKAFKIK